MSGRTWSDVNEGELGVGSLHVKWGKKDIFSYLIRRNLEISKHRSHRSDLEEGRLVEKERDLSRKLFMAIRRR